MKHVVFYTTKQGNVPVTHWLKTLDKTVAARIFERFRRVNESNYGDYKSVGDGVFELKFSFGAGYRVYFAEDGEVLVVLLCGGSKKTQPKDIAKAKEYWQAYLQEKEV